MHTISKLRRKPGSLSLLIAMAVFAALAFAVQASAQRIVTFDAPGAGTGAGQGTYAYEIMDAGAILGDYIDANGVYRGFLRTPDGHITEFDAPGAGTGAGQGTQPAYVSGMNPAGAVSGWYFDANGVYHGFLRTSDGTITEFDAPGAGQG